MASLFAVVGFFLTCLAVLLNILSLSLNFWEKTEFGLQNQGGLFNRNSLTTRKGLWQVCTNLGAISDYMCADLKPDTDSSGGVKLLLVRAALFVAIFALAWSAICMFLKLIVMKGKQLLINVAWILALGGGLMSLCAFAIYTSIKMSGSDYMIAFFLAIVAWIVAWAAGGFLFAASRKKDDLVVM